MPSSPAKMKVLLILAETSRKTEMKLSRSALFHMETRVSLRYFVSYCRSLDSICNSIRYLVSIKSGITYISHNYAKIKVDSCNSLPPEKAITFHDVIILIKSVFNKDKNNYCYNIFLEKATYEFPKK